MMVCYFCAPCTQMYANCYIPAWWEWFPAAANGISGLSFSPGQTVTATVIADSTTAGRALITNDSEGIGIEVTISGESAALCMQDAEWIVEDFDENGGMVPFADFGTVTFIGAVAASSHGEVGPGGGDTFDIYQNKVLTSVSISGEDVTVSYV